MNLYWVNMQTNVGNGYGYSMHSRMLKEACSRAGVENDPLAKVAVHIITGQKFKPVIGKVNVLYTMYECTTIPDSWREPIQQADLIVVPCRQNKELFRQYTKRPIEVCWEGVDVEAYPFLERKEPLFSQFVFLWVGAPNPRKGYQHVGAAWEGWAASGRMPRNVWLYIKSSGVQQEGVLNYPQKRMTVDTRNLSTGDLCDLYHKAHAFLLPSMGEGFGLTLAEAMSTGLPCVYTPWGGPRDFADEKVAYPVKWKFSPVKAVMHKQDGTTELEWASYAAYADVEDIVRRMEQIYHAYPTALQKGRGAAQRIRDGFTWDISARSFLSIIEKHFGGGKMNFNISTDRGATYRNVSREDFNTLFAGKEMAPGEKRIYGFTESNPKPRVVEGDDFVRMAPDPACITMEREND